MSGIAGILNTNGRAVEPDVLEKMVSTIKHRGPDGTDTWIENNIGLARLRMNIAPESYYEKQPGEYDDCILVGDYRIDNRHELITLLGIDSGEKEIVADGDIITAAYAKWGESCAEKILGDFVFVIWDKKKQELYCARDVMGAKTLLYHWNSRQFLFASEIKAIIATGVISRELDKNAVFDYLFFYSYDIKTTSFKNIHHLPPAHFMRISQNGTVIRKYWQLPEKNPLKLNSDDEYAHALLEVFSKAVTDRARTNEPVGVMLSGGLDSSSIACLLARKLATEGKVLYTASSVLPENHNGHETDEREYIQSVLNQEKNIVQEYIVPPKNIFQNDLVREFEVTETPVNCFYYIDNRLIKRLKKHNVRVIFNGIPGDGVVSLPGQNVFAYLAVSLKLAKLLSCAIQQSKVEKKPLWRLLAGRLFLPLIYYFFPLSFLDSNNSPFQGKKIDDIVAYFCLDKRYIGQGAVIDRYTEGIQRRTRERGIHVLNDLKYINGEIFKNFAMEEVYCKQGYYQFEYAFPFFDRSVFEFMNNIPVDKLLMDGWKRGYFRKAMDGILPPKIQWRTNKVPFSPGNGRLVFNELDNMRVFYKGLKKAHVIWEIFDKASLIEKIEQALRIPPEKQIKETLKISRIYMVTRYIDHYFGCS